jgi:hypothetical protein
MEMILIYPVFIGMALATAQLAHQKGYSTRYWFLYALILPILSTIILLFLKKRPMKISGFHAPVMNENKDKVLYRRVN